jgi:hypothetical protein
VAVHARQLAFKPNLQIIRRSRRPLLRGLEQARRSALAHHVPRIAPMGARVLIDGTRYKLPQRSRSSASPRRAMLRVGSAGDIRQWNGASSSRSSAVRRFRGRSRRARGSRRCPQDALTKAGVCVRDAAALEHDLAAAEGKRCSQHVAMFSRFEGMMDGSGNPGL